MTGLVKQTKINVTLNKGSSGILQSSAPITLKNQISEITSIEDINDVAEIERAAGSTLVYNPENDKYEVRKLTATDLPETFNLDGGEF